MEPDVLVRGWIAEVIQAHTDLLAIAIRQRAKFEGWLKFELAAHAQLNGASQVAVEAATDGMTRSRGDLTFYHGGEKCHAELKTCNTNWRMEGVLDLHRPVTKNVAAIVDDARKLSTSDGLGVVAVCMFPVGCHDTRWTQYLQRLSDAVGVPLSADRHTIRVSVPLRGGCLADVVVISFVAPRAGSEGIRIDDAGER
jgi:hypothetical protein